MDKKDAIILDCLKEDASQSTKAIARKTRIPITTIHNRIQKMKSSGLIQKYTLDINEGLRGYPLLAFILVVASAQSNQVMLKKKMSQISEIKEVHIVTGTFDMLLKVRAKSMESLSSFITQKLRTVEGIERTQTLMVLP